MKAGKVAQKFWNEESLIRTLLCTVPKLSIRSWDLTFLLPLGYFSGV